MINGHKPNIRWVYVYTFWHPYTWHEEIPDHLYWTVSYYTQRPSERLRGLIERISFKKQLRCADVQKIVKQWTYKNVCGNGKHSVARAAEPDWCNYIGIVNGSYIPKNELIYGRNRLKSIKIKIEKPKAYCRWCGDPIYKKLSFYWGAHCSKRNCRELNAVYEKKHQIIKLSRKDLLCTDKGYFYETQKLQFIAAFLERKAKWMQRQAKLKEQAAV